MNQQVEVIYEGGVLRPLERLPFAESQHLMVTIASKDESGRGYNPRTKERQWLRDHSAPYAGKYVAIEGDALLGAGDSVKEVMEQARAKGVGLPLVHYVPAEPDLPSAGW